MNIISYFIGGILHKVYIEFGISGVIEVEEEDRDKVMLEVSKLIAKFIKNKNIVKINNNFESVSELDIAEGMGEVAEA